MTEGLRRPVNFMPREGMRDAAKGRRAGRPLQTDCLGELANIEIPSDGRPKFDPLPDLFAAWKARRMKFAYLCRQPNESVPARTSVKPPAVSATVASVSTTIALFADKHRRTGKIPPSI